ncbi:hypothetical protein YC2023_108684 [Brassica napus]
MPRIDRRTGFLRSASDQDASPAPIRFPPDNFKHSLTLFSKSFSSLPRGSGHDGALTLSGAPFQGTWARSVAEDASPDYNSNAEDVQFSSWALPGRRALGQKAWGVTCVQRLDGSRDSAIHTKYRILLRSSSMRDPRYPLPRVVLDFTLQHCFRTNTVSGYAYDPTKTEVLAKDERITTKSAGTVRNRPTESDVSSFSGRSVSRTANHPRRRDPNTSLDHSIGRSDGRGVLKATSADPWSASFMVETRTLFVFHKSKNFTSDYEIRMPPTACFEHSNFFKVTAPEARPGQLRPGAYRRQKRQADRNWKTDETRPRPCKRENLKLGAKRSTGKFAGKVPGKFTGDNPAIDLNPALDSVGPNSPTLRTRTVRVLGVHTDVRVSPSAHTGRPWPSVSTHRTSGCPSVHISARSVDCLGDFGPRGLSVQYTQDVRQHTQDVRGCPCVSVCLSVHTGRPSAHTGRPSAHAGRPWLSVCVRVSVSAHRTSVSTHRTSVSTRRTSVSTRRTSVAVRVCPCVRQCTQDVRQHTQDVRQHTQDVRQHTQDVRGCLCVSVCPSAHAGRPSIHTGCPSAHKGRPWPSVSTHRTSVSTQRTSVAVRQHTQGVRQHTQDVRVWPCVRQYTQDVRQHTQDVRQYTQDVRQHTQDVRGRLSYTQDVRQHTQDVRACPLAHTDCPWTDPCTELISAC